MHNIDKIKLQLNIANPILVGSDIRMPMYMNMHQPLINYIYSQTKIYNIHVHVSPVDKLKIKLAQINVFK